MERTMRKIRFLLAALVVAATTFTGCTEASKVNYNISRQAEYFECQRRITVYNARTDTIILKMEGCMNISNDEYGELVVTVKTGANTYKKNYVYLNEYTLYVIEDITGTLTNPYDYKIYFHTNVLPFEPNIVN